MNLPVVRLCSGMTSSGVSSAGDELEQLSLSLAVLLQSNSPELPSSEQSTQNTTHRQSNLHRTRHIIRAIYTEHNLSSEQSTQNRTHRQRNLDRTQHTIRTIYTEQNTPSEQSTQNTTHHQSKLHNTQHVIMSPLIWIYSGCCVVNYNIDDTLCRCRHYT